MPNDTDKIKDDAAAKEVSPFSTSLEAAGATENETLGTENERVESIGDLRAARNKQIVKTSTVGLIANIVLATFKAIVGLLSNSIAIVLDAVNNLTDALSSIITIVGSKLASKPADKEHPFGHGRAEYFATIVIAVVIMYAGVSSLVESIQWIINGAVAEYTAITIVVVSVAVVVKVLLGMYFKKSGRKVESDSLVASGTDATMDAFISASTLIAAIISIVWGISIEAWLGAAIAIIIIKAGLDILRQSFSKALGQRAKSSLSQNIKRTVNSIEGVHGSYDLTLMDYGPEYIWGSMHIAVDSNMTAMQIDRLTRKIQNVVYKKHGVILTAVGIYSTNTDDALAKMQLNIMQIAWNNHDVMEVHGLFIDEVEKTVMFDIVVGYDVKDREMVRNDIMAMVTKEYPDYRFYITLDADFCD